MDDSERSDTEAEGSSYSFLTKRQLAVLQMRHQGLSQQGCGRSAGTTRSNISTWRRGLTRILPDAEDRSAVDDDSRPDLFIRAEGTDVFDIPRMISRLPMNGYCCM